VTPATAAGVILAVGLALAATVLGVRTGWHPADADEIVYRDTLLQMRRGVGVYQAQREALIIKEHAPPTSVRAIRPPTLFLVLRWFPPSSWRWLVGLVYLADLLLVWRLARIHGPPVGVAAVALAGVWLLGFCFYLFLHAEVWGMPLFLGGLLALRRDRAWTAAALFLAAACVRELYVTGLLGGAVLAVVPARAGSVVARLKPWLSALVAAAGLYAVHTALAEGVLSAHGYNARFGNEHRTATFLLRLVSPFSSNIGEWLGVVTVVAGLAGAVSVARRDRAAIVGAASSALILVASVWATRVYWSAAWALPLAAFAPVGLVLATRSLAGAGRQGWNVWVALSPAEFNASPRALRVTVP